MHERLRNFRIGIFYHGASGFALMAHGTEVPARLSDRNRCSGLGRPPSGFAMTKSGLNSRSKGEAQGGAARVAPPYACAVPLSPTRWRAPV
jgi:hypothetical protein